MGKSHLGLVEFIEMIKRSIQCKDLKVVYCITINTNLTNLIKTNLQNGENWIVVQSRVEKLDNIFSFD